MSDPRFDKLANVLVHHSTQIKKDENVLIEAIDIPEEMVIALVRCIRKAGEEIWEVSRGFEQCLGHEEGGDWTIELDSGVRIHIIIYGPSETDGTTHIVHIILPAT